MPKTEDEWYEKIDIGGNRTAHLSKFLRENFHVPAKLVEERWPQWTPEQRLKFAGAFSARAELTADDQRVLDFLIENGESRIWRTIALSIAKHRNRGRALEFLLARVREGVAPLANYYQAMGMLSAAECVPALKEALLKHREEVDLHPVVQSWGDRFIYLDYLSCSATLFVITGQEEYRANLEGMLQHSDKTVRKQVRMIAKSRGIAL